MADSKPSWRGDGRGQRPRGGRSRWPRLAALGALGLAVAAGVGSTLWTLRAQKPPTVFAAVDPSRPTAAADLGGLKAEGLDLRDLAARARGAAVDAPLVVYLAAPARVDGGRIALGLDGRIGLDDVLLALRRPRPAVKLLLLDLSPHPADGLDSGLPYEDIWTPANVVFAAAKVPGLRVLTSAGAGQGSAESTIWGQSTFAHYVGLGLAGGEADEDADGVVTVGELAAFVAPRVDDWARVHLDARQVPALIAPAGAADPRLADVAPRPPKPKAAPKVAADEAPKAEPPPKYPDALLAGWERRDRWRAERFYEVAPRPYRRLESALLDAERAWRLGAPASGFGPALETALNLARNADAEWRPTAPETPPMSLAEAARAGLAADPSLVEAVGALARQVADKPAKELDDAWSKLARPFEGDDPARSFALAWATVAAGRDADRRLPPPGVRLPRLAAWLAQGHPEPRFAETASLRRIATGSATDDLSPRRALEAACLVAELDARPRTLARFPRETRDAADRAHRAEVLLRSAGFVPAGLADAAAEEALRAAADLRAKARSLEAGQATAWRAMAALPGAATLSRDAPGDWVAAIQQVGALRQAIDDADWPAVDAGAARLGASLSGFEASASRPGAPDDPRVAERVRAAADPAAGGRQYAALVALVDSTIPSAADRPKLDAAARSLARRLDEAHSTHPFGPPPAAEADPRPAADRASIARARLAAAGGEPPEVATPSAYRAAWAALLAASTGPDDRLARLAPPWLEGPAIDDLARSPERLARIAEAGERHARLADRLAAEAEDLDGDPFARKSALAHREATPGPRPGPAPRVVADGPLDLSGSTAAAVPLRLQANGSRSPIRSLKVFAPDDPRLRIELAGVGPGAVDPASTPTLRASWSPDALPKGDRRPRPAGVLVQAAWGDRTLSTKVPIVGLPTGDEPVLLLADAPIPARLKLRPLAAPQPLALAVRNPGPSAIKVVVEVAAPGLSTRGTLAIPAGATAAFKPEAPAKPGDMVELDGPITARVLDEAGKVELARAVVAVEVLDPSQYVRVVPGTAQYQPKSPEDRAVNRLDLQVQLIDAGQPPGGPPSRVALNLEAAVDPATPPKDLSPAATLDPASLEPAPLRASGFARRPGAVGDATIYLDVDGVPRALKLRANLSAAGPARRPVAEDLAPAVLPLIVPRYIDAAAPRPAEVVARVDNAPPGARLTLSLSTVAKPGAPAVVLQSAVFSPPRRARVRWWVDPALGPVLRAELTDAVWPLALGGDRGPREVRASLVVPDGGPERSATALVTLDDRPPTIARPRLPATIPAGATSVRVAVEATSGTDIASVAFYPGSPPEPGQKPKEKPIAATLDRASGLWIASIPLRGDERGRLEVTARAVNGIGRDAYAEATALVLPPEPAGGKPPQPGRIAGTVVLGTIPQPEVPVVLRDAKAAEVARTKTDADGHFAFAKLPPGSYKIVAQKPFPIRTGTADATVADGQEATVQVDLNM